MDIVIYILCFLLLLKYGFVLYKYLKTGEFKKKVYKGNIIGIIAYSCLTILLICFLILIVLVNKDKSSDLLMWILFASALGTIIMYIWFWQQRTSDNAKSKKQEIARITVEEFTNTYGNEDYDEFKIEHFDIPNDVIIDERFNSLIAIITNNQLSHINPNQYKNIADVFESLYQEDYIKLLNDSESIVLTCEKVNSLLKKNNIDFNITSEDIIKDDDEYIKARRKDFIPTMVHDLYKIDEIIKNNLNDYELVAFAIYDKEENTTYPAYLCIAQKSKYDKFFKVNINGMESVEDEQ